MSEKKINTLLFIILGIAVISYLCFNVLFVEPVSKAENSNNSVTGSVCSCEGTERPIITSYGNESGDAAANFQITEVAEDNDYYDYNGLHEDNNLRKESGIYEDNNLRAENKLSEESDLHEDNNLREDASSIQTTEETGEKKYNVNPKGWYIFIDLDDKLMHVYKDGEQIKTYEVSGGKPNSPSPLGTWKIISKDTWGEGFGGAWLGFNVPWGKYGIHGTTDPWAVGKSNNSKGCIRMRNKEVRELYKLVPHNTLVTIVYENIPFYPMRDGDVGSDVLSVERALKKLGYYHGGEDGVYGASLKKAVMEFQKDNKLYRTGVVNNSTYEKIIAMEKEFDEKQQQLKQEQEAELRRLEKELE